MTVVEINNTNTFDLLFKDNNPHTPHTGADTGAEKRIYVDVGGYNGDTVTEALNINPNLRIIVIEPIKSLADAIQQKFQLNKNVTVVNKAAWNNKCIIPFNEYEGWAKGLSTNQSIMTQLRPEPQFTNQILKYNVDADTLNNILSDLNINTVDYLKIDTEGSEEQVLSGFTKYHNDTRFHVEHHLTNLSNILQKLQEIGSDIEKITVSRDCNIKEHVVGAVIGKFCKNRLDLSNCVYNEGYFTGESNIGYRYPGYKNFDNNHNVIKYILNQNPIPKSVIEIGGARGYITRMLEEKNIKSTCVDVSKYCWDTRATDSFMLHDITNKPLPFTDKQWDLLFTKDLMEHLPESKIDDIIKDMERISERSIHAITFSTHPTATEDITHTLLRTKDWWINKFKEIVPDYNVDIIDKELFNYDIDIDISKIEKPDTNTIKAPSSSDKLIITEGPIQEDKLKIIDTYTDRKLKIALISTPFFTVPPSKYGGLEQIVWDLAESLDSLGHNVTIFAPKGSKVTPHGKLVVICESHNTVNVNWFELEKECYNVYRQHINSQNFDIVHGHGWFGFEYLLKQEYPNLNIIHTMHGGLSWNSPPNW